MASFATLCYYMQKVQQFNKNSIFPTDLRHRKGEAKNLKVENVRQFFRDIVMTIRKLLQAGTPQSEDERLICENWLARRNDALARIMLYYGLFFHSTSLVIHPMLVNPLYKSMIVSVHLFILTAEICWVLFMRRQSRIKLPQFILAMEICAVVAFGVICHLAYFNPGASLNEKIYASNAFICIAALLTIVIPFHSKVVGWTTLGYFLISVAVLYDGNSVPAFWINVTATMLSCSLVLHWGHTTITRMAAIKELRIRAGMAPLQIVRRSVTEETSVESVFAPKLRYCVCVSSDWRSFQELTTRIDAKSVSEALSAYYQMCNEELRQRFPSGNYYSDWIADELFIVVFTENPLETMQLTKDALEFSRAILESKARFVIDHDFPFAIDIGMSVGQAMVGMMGPVQHRKATALGEVPGRSRRLQGTGKLLRYHLGERDRVIFDETLAETLPDQDGVQTFTLTEDRKLRDLNCRTLHFVELNQDFRDLLLPKAG
jgi:hypothetical protein